MLKSLLTAGIKAVNITFYGDEEYHDRFAGRVGDYKFLIGFVKSLVDTRLSCTTDFVICEENKNMLEDLFKVLSEINDAKYIHSFLPDYRGRGYLLEAARLKKKSYEALSAQVKNTLNIRRYKTEKEWLEEESLPEYTRRALIINLRQDNIDMLEKMSCDEIVAYIEKLDDNYYGVITAINKLAEIYGDKGNDCLYRLRDLFWKWQAQYLKDHNITIYNVTDERYCSVIRS